ncbi:MAG TPA: nitroreductase family deazaflavin-dependent oxidoreductase [Thermoleophilaceae bacterium]|nr:nitroreductase family deazaflavin-dependent oxidoreductase [Thermoleophilaceae bacterium]
MASDRAWSRFSSGLGDRGLRLVGKLNVPVYRLTNGRLMGRIGRAPVLLLTTTGRKSGESRTAPVVYLADRDRYVVIGSNAGNDRTPAWALNLRADPKAEVQVRRAKLPVRARIAEGEERAELWKRVNEQYSGFDDYKERTSRDISVFVLEPVSAD